MIYLLSSAASAPSAWATICDVMDGWSNCCQYTSTVPPWLHCDIVQHQRSSAMLSRISDSIFDNTTRTTSGSKTLGSYLPTHIPPISHSYSSSLPSLSAHLSFCRYVRPPTLSETDSNCHRPLLKPVSLLYRDMRGPILTLHTRILTLGFEQT